MHLLTSQAVSGVQTTEFGNRNEFHVETDITRAMHTGIRMVFPQGAENLAITNLDPQSERLFQLLTPWPPPRVLLKGNYLSITMSRWPSRRRRVRLELTSRIPFSIETEAGVKRVTAELNNIDLQTILIGSGVRDLHMILPSARRQVPINLAGGARDLRLSFPSSSPASISLVRGATGITVARRQFSTGPDVLHLPGSDPFGYDIVCQRGVAGLSVDRVGSA